MTPERTLKSRIRKDLIARGAWVYAPVPGGMGAATVDILCCFPRNGRHTGVFVGIEAKSEGKRPTPRQETTMREIDAAGGITFWCDTFDSYLRNMVMKGLISTTATK